MVITPCLVNFIIADMEEVRICISVALRPFDISEYGRIVRRHPPSRSIVDIPKSSGEDKDNIMEWLGLWNRAVMANGWSFDDEMVMFPSYLFGRKKRQHFNAWKTI